jgi:hypothetical protein
MTGENGVTPPAKHTFHPYLSFTKSPRPLRLYNPAGSFAYALHSRAFRTPDDHPYAVDSARDCDRPIDVALPHILVVCPTQLFSSRGRRQSARSRRTRDPKRPRLLHSRVQQPAVARRTSAGHFRAWGCLGTPDRRRNRHTQRLAGL